MNWTDFVHREAINVLRAGDRCIDATVGNGHDAEFLAEAVGPTGAVLGVDVQAVAIASANERLRDYPQVSLVCAGHETLLELVPADWPGTVRVITFNLGYLPGHDHELVTRAETTLAAIRASLQLLTPGGLLALVVYTGHAGALEEAGAVQAFVEALDRRGADCSVHRNLNGSPAAPYCILVRKSGG